MCPGATTGIPPIPGSCHEYPALPEAERRAIRGVCRGRAGRRAIRGVCHEYRVSPPALDMRVVWFAVLVVGIVRWLDVML